MSTSLFGTVLVIIGLLMIHPGLAFIGVGLLLIIAGYSPESSTNKIEP